MKLYYFPVAPNPTKVREAWGLVLLAAWTAVLLFFALWQRRRRDQEP